MVQFNCFKKKNYNSAIRLQWISPAFGKYMDLQLSVRYALVCHIFGFVKSINRQ